MTFEKGGPLVSGLIFDSHAHYDDEQFDGDREGLLCSLPDNGVCGIVNAAVDEKSAAESIRLSERFPFMYTAIGVHPQAAQGVDPERLCDWMLPYLSHPKAVAVGEIGLDYHYEDACPREQQLKVFEKQLEIAVEKDFPVVVHDREAHADTLALLKKYRPRGVVHCFSGSVEMMWEVVSLGMSIGLGGVVTFKNAKHPVMVAEEVPLDRLLLETDAPYMAPVPMRGHRCDSSMISYTAERIAELRGMKAEDLLQKTAENAALLFGINR